MEEEMLLRNRGLQKKIQAIEQRLVGMIHQKSEQLNRRISERDEELTHQISQLRLSCSNSVLNHSNKLNMNNARLQKLQSSLTRSLDRLTQVQGIIAGFIGHVEVTRNQFSAMEGNLKKQILRVGNENLQKQILRVGNELSLVASNVLNTPHFNPVFHPNKLAIIRLVQDGSYRGFIRNLSLPHNQVSTYEIRQTKTVNKSILTGIATNAVFGATNPHSNKECLAYYSINGSIYENGSAKTVGRAVSDGEVIAILVDTANWQIKWSVKNQQLAATVIPQQMRNKSLYIVVSMYSQNDVVEILLD